uniref:Uncharacterized protein n=1 Tax=Oryzias latipes TaxID=8090 RepID=A0A3P9JT72_ORYLA
MSDLLSSDPQGVFDKYAGKEGDVKTLTKSVPCSKTAWRNFWKPSKKLTFFFKMLGDNTDGINDYNRYVDHHNTNQCKLLSKKRIHLPDIRVIINS